MTLTPASTLKTPLVTYQPDIEQALETLQTVISANSALSAQRYNTRWLALSLLEGDADLVRAIGEVHGGPMILAEVDKISAQLGHALGEDVDTLIADQRYQFIAGVLDEVVTRSTDADITFSDRVDRVVTHRWLGVPIFLVLMWVVFQMTANVSAILVDWIDGVLTGPFSRWIVAVLDAIGLGGSWVESLVLDGVIAGVGGVLVFVPVLAFMYFFIALLEDSGYMARAAFVMDRFMRVLGLHGKSFIPLLVGFGCSVPGIYATRTLEDRRDRILTGLLVPFMSCAARLPVYVLIGSAFFGSNSGNLVFAMYLLGIAVAVVSGFLLRRTLFQQSAAGHFVMEMPPFRRPSLRTIGRQSRERTWGFVRNVWTVIMVASVVVWVLLNIPYQDGEPPELEESLFGSMSKVIAPVLVPAGFGDWQASGSLVSGLVAKEVVVSTMSQVYGVEETGDGAADTPTFLEDVGEIVAGFGKAVVDTAKATVSIVPGVNLLDEADEDDTASLQAALRDKFSALEAVAFAVFVLLYTPCIATIGAIRHEFGTRWMWFSVAYMLGVAWLAAVLTYQVGRLLGLG
ncbi:MAG: ferrous iron transport protein B [Chloroflexi bacterium]|nr:ferrous iron transport protein B [Chloroflexota bacterium]